MLDKILLMFSPFRSRLVFFSYSARIVWAAVVKHQTTDLMTAYKF